jgi:hypothetical protein
LDFTNLETWSPFIGKKITKVQLGWAEEDWGRELGSHAYQAVYWLNFHFSEDSNLQLMPASSTESKVKHERIIEFSGYGDSDTQSKRYFEFTADDLTVVFDQALIQTILADWHRAPWLIKVMTIT